MEKLFLLIFTILLSYSINAGELRPCMNHYSNSYQEELDMIAGEGDQLYVAGSAGIYCLENIYVNWQKIMLLKENKRNFSFFRSPDYTIYFTNNNTLFRIDKSTRRVEVVFATATPIKKMFFEEDRIILMEERQFNIVDLSFNLLQRIDLKEFLQNKSTFYQGIPFLSYSRTEGFLISHQVQLGMEDYYYVHNSKDNGKTWVTQPLYNGTSKEISFATNLSENIIMYILGDGSDTVWYDLKNNREINTVDIKLSNTGDSKKGIKFSEVGNLLACLDNNDISNVHFSSDRGQTWKKINIATEQSISQSGILYLRFEKRMIDAYFYNNKTSLSIPFPFATSEEFTSDFNTVFEVNNRLWTSLRDNNAGILKSEDRGLNWFNFTVPYDYGRPNSFFVDTNENIYYTSSVGLVTADAYGNFQALDSFFTRDIVKMTNIIGKIDDYLVLSKKVADNDYKIYKYYLNSNFLEDVGINYATINLYQDKCLISNPDNLGQLQVYNKDFVLEKTYQTDTDTEIIKAVMDSNQEIYVSTNLGLLKASKSSNELKVFGGISDSVVSMFLTEKDSLYVLTYSGKDLYTLNDSRDNLVPCYSNYDWDSELIQYVGKNQFVLTRKHDPWYATMKCGYLSEQEILEINLDASNSSHYVMKDSGADLHISSNSDNYTVHLKQKYGLLDTTFVSTEEKCTYHINSCEPNQVLTFEVSLTKDGYEPSITEFINFYYHDKYLNANIVPTFQNKYNQFHQGQTAKINFAILDTGSNRLAGTIYMSNNISNNPKEQVVTQGQEAEYQFDIPEDTKKGIYRVYYSGKSSSFGNIEERYTYFVVNHIQWESISEPNSIIKNAKVFPNPTANSAAVDFQMEEAGDLTCEIYDLSGKLIMSIPTEGYYAAGKANLSFDVSMLQSGQYMIFLTAKDKVTASKLIIER